MKTLTINVPDSMDIDRERQLIVESWLKEGKVTIAQIDQMGLSYVTFNIPSQQENSLLHELNRPVSEDFDLDKIKQEKQNKRLDWQELDRLAERLAIKEPFEELVAQIGK